MKLLSSTDSKVIHKNEEISRRVIENLPAPIYTTDAYGYVTSFNEAATSLWGRTPEIGKDLWCGSWKIYRPDGSPLPLEDCPMAIALKEKRPVYGQQIIIEQPDGRRLYVEPHPRPIFDQEGKLIGAVNMLVDYTDIRKSELALQDKEKQLLLLNQTLEKKVEERTREMVREVWNELGLANDLVSLQTAEQALSYLEAVDTAPFIIICELNLPKIDGFELRERMLSNPSKKFRSVPFIFWSTYASEEQITHAYNLSVHGFFIKESSFEALKKTFINIINYWLSSKMPSKTADR